MVKPRQILGIGVCLLILMGGSALFAAKSNKSNWQKHSVDFRTSNGSRIKSIKYPKDKPVKLRSDKKAHKQLGRKTTTTTISTQMATAPVGSGSITVNIIDSPPIDGFIPWIAMAVSDEREPADNMDFVGKVSHSYSGSGITGAAKDFVLGIFDTGASATVMGHWPATDLGLFIGGVDNDLITESTIEVSGVTGSVEVLVSQPMGIYIDGLSAVDTGVLEPNGLLGETNVSIVVGGDPCAPPVRPDLPVAVGTPLSVYYTAVFDNANPITVNYGGSDYTGPDIDFYPNDACNVQSYSQIVPLELRPMGGLNVQYAPSFDLIFDLFSELSELDLSFPPGSPSVIMGNLSQSIFFVHSVDLADGFMTATDRSRFMLDTGAQVTVIGSRVGARLGLDPENPEFTVEIQGVTGTTTDEPGFYIDSIEIPALGGWLRFANVPVILLDVFSPEGGTLDGIIGMNLLDDFNFVLRGGGLFLMDDPRLELEYFGDKILVDIAPAAGDGKVDEIDLTAFADAWLARSTSANWNVKCDMAPPTPDGIINMLDFAVLAKHWREVD
jgi:predicted aspartyl protease